MSATHYGTDHGRYLDSGIVFLSQIAETSRYDSYLCEKERKEIENQFQRGACQPWAPEGRLKAELSWSHWDARFVGETRRLRSYDFSVLHFSPDAVLSIMGSVARLEALKSSNASGLMNVFNLLNTRERWWVVDLFWKDGSPDERLALDWKKEAVRSFFCFPSGEWDVTRPPRKSLLTTTIYQEADRVSNMGGISCALHELSRVPSLWNTKSFTYLADVRMSFCDEEVENYIWAIVEQWKDITLQWNPRVMQCVDFEFISALQSRAPCLSKNDLDDIQDAFRQADLLPRLTEQPLRDRVEVAICRQGPILTLETFAQDARLLQSRVRKNLREFLLDMNRKRKRDTLRKRVGDAIGREFDAISCASGLPIASYAQRQASVKRCYHHLFLLAISSSHSVTSSHVREVVNQELAVLPIDARVCNQRGPITHERDLAPLAPADDLPDIEVHLKKRHGCLLFDSSIATKHSYYDPTSDGPISTTALTQLFMAKHIVRIFLLGNAITERTGFSSPDHPIHIAQSRSSTALSTASRSNSHDSAFQLSHVGRSPGSPTCLSIHSTPTVKDVCRSRPQIRKATVSSMVASLVDAEHSPTHSTRRPKSKRPLSLYSSQQDADTISAPVKRLCQGSFDQQELTIQRLSPEDPEYRRSSPSIQDGRGQATDMVSPSVYSTDGRSSISQTDSRRPDGVMHPGKEACYGIDIAQDYIDLLDESCLYSEQLHCSASQSKAVFPDDSRADAPSLQRCPPREPRLRMPVHEATEGYHARDVPGHVLYKSSLVKNMTYRAPRDKHSTNLFVASLKKKDGRSRFWYNYRGVRKHATNGDQVHKAIRMYGLDTVFVHSRSLGRVED